jgi:hypothetical protein
MDGTATCERCGNTYDKPMTIQMFGDPAPHLFDSFECAIDALAMRCVHCGIRIVGHGVEEDGAMFCCASCARMEGVRGVADRGDEDAVGASSGSDGGGSAPTRPPSDS